MHERFFIYNFPPVLKKDRPTTSRAPSFSGNHNNT